MWSKLTNAIKRPGTPGLNPDDTGSSLHPHVMDGVYERHPNLSVFHEDTSEVPFPSPSPPPSPSKRKGLLKRISTNPFAEHETGSQPSSLRIPIGLPKKVKSSIHSTSSGEYTMLKMLYAISASLANLSRKAALSSAVPALLLNAVRLH